MRTMFFGCLFVSRVPVQTPSRGVDLPGCYGNLELLHNRERPLQALVRVIPFRLCNGNSGLGPPGDRLQIRRIRGERSIEKSVGFRDGIR